jgi:hypothetical protein
MSAGAFHVLVAQSFLSFSRSLRGGDEIANLFVNTDFVQIFWNRAPDECRKAWGRIAISTVSNHNADRFLLMLLRDRMSHTCDTMHIQCHETKYAKRL